MSQLNQELKARFPNMTPIHKAPTMMRINGCGVAMYGSRDVDRETGAYVATWCVSILFVPLLALRAYRVVRGGGMWRFLGREPLSAFARWCNFLVVSGALGTVAGVQITSYLTSPAYHARLQMSAAHHLAEQGHLADAAVIYRQLALAGAEQSDNAVAAVKAMLQDTQAPLSEYVGVIGAAAQIGHKNPAIALAEVADFGMKLVANRGDSDPRSALAVLDLIRPLVLDTRPVDDRRLPLLQKWAAAEPGNLDAVVPLASLLMERNQLDAAGKLLMPLKDKLGGGEGARVLGMILARSGDPDGAYALLWPYVKGRLDVLHVAEKAAGDAFTRIETRELDVLRNNQGPKDFYDKYNAANPDQQGAMVRQYVLGKLKNDPEFISTQAEFEKQCKVVPVALDLGMVMLQRAQGLGDPAARKAQLESAKTVFLAIGGVAGESDEYRLSLAQVHYWLGEQAEGKKLFDELLATNSRAFQSLLEVAQAMRSVGLDADARTLAEEAYQKAGKNEERYLAAAFRALIYKDVDDQILWLQRGDPADNRTKGDMALSVGNKALEEGRNDDAAAQYRVAIDAFATLPHGAGSMNETALAYLGIFRATGDRQAFDRCVDYFQQAVDLSPSDTTLISNAGVMVLEGAVSDVVGNAIDQRALRQTSSLSLLGYLYHDQASRQEVVDRMKSHPGITRALAFLQKLMVLAPKTTGGYAVVYEVQGFTRDTTALKDLLDRINTGKPDTSDQLRALKESLAGTRDQQDITRLTALLKQNRDLADKLHDQGGLTRAVALDNQVEALVGLDRLGRPQDAGQIVALAQEARNLAATSATNAHLEAAYEFRACANLRKSNPDFAAFFDKYQRVLEDQRILAFLAGEPGPMQKLVVQDPDFRAALELTKQDWAAYPTSRDPGEWAMLKNYDAAASAEVARVIAADPRQEIDQSISKALYPYNASQALSYYWYLQMQNKPEDARAALKKVADLGVPVPLPAGT